MHLCKLTLTNIKTNVLNKNTINIYNIHRFVYKIIKAFAMHKIKEGQVHYIHIYA